MAGSRSTRAARKRVKATAAPAASAPPTRPEVVDVYSPDGRVFTERHQDHPGGEVWIAGDGPQPSETVTVARTLAVERAIRAGRLKEVPRARKAAAKAPKETGEDG